MSQFISYATSDTGYVGVTDVPDTWVSVHGYTTGGVVVPSDPLYCMSYTNSGNTSMLRQALYFNTSLIHPSDTITSASLYLRSQYASAFISGNKAFEVCVGGSHPSIPLAEADFNYTYYASNSVGTGTYVDNGIDSDITITLSQTGLNNINRGGITRFMLLTNEDYTNTDPGLEIIILPFYPATDATYKPKLTINYTKSPNKIQSRFNMSKTMALYKKLRPC